MIGLLILYAFGHRNGAGASASIRCQSDPHACILFTFCRSRSSTCMNFEWRYSLIYVYSHKVRCLSSYIDFEKIFRSFTVYTGRSRVAKTSGHPSFEIGRGSSPRRTNEYILHRAHLGRDDPVRSHATRDASDQPRTTSSRVHINSLIVAAEFRHYTLHSPLCCFSLSHLLSSPSSIFNRSPYHLCNHHRQSTPMAIALQYKLGEHT